jgi:hypothetical protein
MDARAHRVLEADPDGLIMPRIYLGTPDWWLKAHPDELQLLHDGTTVYPKSVRTPVPKETAFPSIASARWREESAQGLRRLIEHIQQSDYAAQIFGYTVTGLFTEEWYHWSSGSDLLAEYSPHMARAFRDWLRGEYGTVERLRDAWNDPSADFDSVAVPKQAERVGDRAKTFRDPAREMPVIDFYRFYNEIIPETIDYFCKTAREASGGSKAVGTFYGYMFEFAGDPEFGHNALSRLLESPHLDFMMVTASYFNRQLGSGADYMRSPMTSVALHQKLWYHDADTVSYRFWEIMKGAKEGYGEGTIGNTAANLGVTRTPQETIWMYQRGAGFTLGAGVFQSFFDLHGGYFDDPQLMAEIKRLNALFEQSKQYDRSSCSQILVISDERSCAYTTFRSPLLRQSLQPPQPELTKVGAPHDSILVDDLALLDTDPYRLVIFLNAYHLTDRQRALIRHKLLCGGKTVVWSYAPGLFNGPRADPEQMAALTGLRIVPSEDETRVAPRIALVESDHPLSQRLKAAGLSTIGPEGTSGKLFSVHDSGAMVLGTLPGSTAATLAMKVMDGWISIYTITPTLPAAFYREVARAAGVHIYNEADDTLYVSRCYLTLNVDKAGLRTLRFPQRCDVFDPFTGERLHAGVTQFTQEFQAGETRIVRWAASR